LETLLGQSIPESWPEVLSISAIRPKELWGGGLLLGNHGTLTMGTTHRVIDGLLAVMLREVSSFPSWPDIKVRREQKPDIAEKLTCTNKEFALQRA